MYKLFTIIISFFLFISCGTDKQGATPFGWIILGFIITIPLIAWMMNHDKGEKHKDNPKYWLAHHPFGKHIKNKSNEMFESLQGALQILIKRAVPKMNFEVKLQPIICDSVNDIIKYSLVSYELCHKINSIKNNIKTHNKIRSLIFPPFQLPIYKGNKIIKSIFKKDKIYLNYEI